MAMTLQQAIDFASVPSYEKQYGTMTNFTVSMHDDSDTVLAGSELFEEYGPDEPGGKPTFRPDLPLRSWGPATFNLVRTVTGRWFQKPPVPGFSTRGQGGMQLAVAVGGTAAPMPIDVSVRRDPGLPYLRFLGWGPSVQIEIERLSGPGGTATTGVTLNAVEDGALLRAVGPSIRDPASNASYTVTIWIIGRPG
jgi:hypothetical protein